MAQNKLQNAIDAYGTFCRVLDKHNWNYQKNEEKLVALINSEVGMERLELIQETIMKIGLLI